MDKPNVRLGHENVYQVRLVKVRLVIFVHSQSSSVEHNINQTKSGQQLCSTNVLFHKYRIVEHNHLPDLV
jgi:hypothetical protein